MNWISPVMGVVSALLTVYLLLLIVRILLTWVSMDHGHPALRILHGVTDPFLNWFRRFRFLVIGQLDFTPLAALLVVNFLASLARMIGMYGQVSVGIVLTILLQLLWGAASFFFFFLGALSLIRYLAIRFRWGGQGLWAYLDAVLQPPAAAVGRRIRPGTFVSYTTSLLVLALVNLAIAILGSVGVTLLSGVLQALPF